MSVPLLPAADGSGVSKFFPWLPEKLAERLFYMQRRKAMKYFLWVEESQFERFTLKICLPVTFERAVRSTR